MKGGADSQLCESSPTRSGRSSDRPAREPTPGRPSSSKITPSGDGDGGGDGGSGDEGDDEWWEEGEEEEDDEEEDSETGTGTSSSSDEEEEDKKEESKSDKTTSQSPAPRYKTTKTKTGSSSVKGERARSQSQKASPESTSAAKASTKSRGESRARSKSRPASADAPSSKNTKGSTRSRGRSTTKRGRSSSLTREKEHPKIEVRKLPEFNQCDAWYLALIEAVASCANRNDSRPVIEWLNKVKSVKSVEKLSLDHCPEEFMRMEHKLATALSGILEGQIGRTINNMKKAQLRKTGNSILAGRQILYLILQEYRTNKSLGRYYSTVDMEQYVWLGDEVNQLRRFLNNVEDLVSGLHSDISEFEKREWLVNRMEDSKVFEMKLDKFKNRKNSDKKKTFDALLKIIEKHISDHTEKENRKKKKAGLGGKAGAKGAGPTAMAAKSQSVCQAYLRGQCPKARKDCFYAHPEGMEGALVKLGGGKGKKDKGSGKGGGGKSKGKGKDKDKRSPSQPRSPSPAGSRGLCNFIRDGKTCPYGNDCKFDHQGKQQGRAHVAAGGSDGTKKTKAEKRKEAKVRKQERALVAKEQKPDPKAEAKAKTKPKPKPGPKKQ